MVLIYYVVRDHVTGSISGEILVKRVFFFSQLDLQAKGSEGWALDNSRIVQRIAPPVSPALATDQLLRLPEPLRRL